VRANKASVGCGLFSRTDVASPAGGLTALVLVFSLLKRSDEHLNLNQGHFGADMLDVMVVLAKNYKMPE
jgi:hypothetical protein